MQRAKEARGRIAEQAIGFLGDGNTVITFGSSRVVRAVLDMAAHAHKRFQVVYVEGSSDTTEQRKLARIWLSNLRKQDVPTAVVSFEKITSVIARVSFAMVGAESIVENGGSVSRMGTHQLAQLARSAGKPLYVVAESYKFVRVYPLEEADVWGRGQCELRFGVGEESTGGQEDSENHIEAVDLTPPELITALVTEAGVQMPSSVSEELIKIWDG